LLVRANAAQVIGLALHELTTNAAKYGALSTDRGRIDIPWGTEGNTFTMSWTERDGPSVYPPRRRGFGTIVMQEMAERSLGGRVEFDYALAGVTWRLTCPAANVLEPGERHAASNPP
jgi:two-component sensor histidine kinase